jgi:hypothetical protein
MRSRAFVTGLLLASLLFVCVFVSVRPGYAWTFSFDFGEAKNQWSYAQYGQMGRKGFFGPYDVDNSSNPGSYANLNSWVGNSPDVNQIASGSNAAIGQVSVNVDPHLGNEWIKLKGRYNINLYQTGISKGAFNPMSSSFLTMWSLDVDLPIFRIGYGKRGFQQGFGLQFDFNRTSEYLVIERDLVVPDILGTLVAKGVLPRGVLSYFNPLAWGRYKTELTDEDPDPSPCDEAWPKMRGSYAGGALYPGTLKLGFGVAPWQQQGTAFILSPLAFPVTAFNVNDVSSVVEQNWIVYARYTSTDFNIGIGTTRIVLHAGPELFVNNPSVPNDSIIRNHTPTQELYLTEGWAFLTYNNGSIFCSAELDWYNRIFRTLGTYDGLVWLGGPGPVSPIDPVSGVSRFAPQYVESWRFLAEAGLFFGPSSLKGMFAFMPGQDRRHGILIDRQPFVQAIEQQATSVFDPYSVHLNYVFSGGVDAFQHISAATAFGLKADYMLASNLLVFGTFFKAVRNAHGYGLGYIRPSVQAAPPLIPVSDPGAFGTVNYKIRGTFAGSSPSVPDNDLGWELTAGLTWQLAEGNVVDARFSYWQPGKWFNYACIDRSVPNWNIPGAGNNWGVNPNRTIDPVFGFEIRLAASY